MSVICDEETLELPLNLMATEHNINASVSPPDTTKGGGEGVHLH